MKLDVVTQLRCGCRVKTLSVDERDRGVVINVDGLRLVVCPRHGSQVVSRHQLEYPPEPYMTPRFGVYGPVFDQRPRPHAAPDC